LSLNPLNLRPPIGGNQKEGRLFTQYFDQTQFLYTERDATKLFVSPAFILFADTSVSGKKCDVTTSTYAPNK
jgi:hypothetical protein